MGRYMSVGRIKPKYLYPSVSTSILKIPWWMHASVSSANVPL